MIVKAFVVLNPERVREVPADELQEFVRQAIAPYKRPRAVEFCDELPRTSTGKLQRYKLR
jgi:2-aminobenzoate-CoA ligase